MGLTILREGGYRASRKIGCWRGGESAFSNHQVHGSVI
jgi:hypothetical protein